ncbi:uncharacterized protein LOC113463909 isoform X2 [Ceratina calcarata]|nr:uncharacterized protein LOC113463909 isoform X2 [Ceratina calcarata]
MNRPFWREDPESSYQVAVVPVGFPNRVFTISEAEDFGDALSRCVMNYIETRRKKSLRFVQPEFLSFFRKNGGILLSCDTEVTVRWLKVAIKFVKLSSGCGLQIESKEALDNRFLVEGRGTHSRFNGNNIISNLQTFNGELDVSRWRVVREKYTRSGTIITLEMEGRSVGMLRKKRNRLSLDQAGVHKFNILNVTRVRNARPAGEPAEVDISEDDFTTGSGDAVETLADAAGIAVSLNDSTTIENVPSQRDEGVLFDAAGDEFILSVNLEQFEGNEVSDDAARIVGDESVRGSSTPVRTTARTKEGFSHGRDRTKGKATLNLKSTNGNGDDSGVGLAGRREGHKGGHG